MTELVGNDEVMEFDTIIDAVSDEAAGIRSLRLRPAEGDKMPRWEPGAHIDVILPNGLVRQYSLCGAIDDPTSWQITVLREPASRGGSEYVHEQLSVGDRIRVRGPRNNFGLEPADEYIFVAGGIGITPLLPMIERCVAEDKTWRLHYGGRSIDSMAFTEALAIHPDEVTYWPQDQRGLMDLGSFLDEVHDGVAIYCCGPGGLLDAVEEKSAHWPAGSLHVERFQPKEGALSGPRSAFEVELDESGLILTVGEDQTIIDVLEAAGVHVPSSCREGTCGTCETVVLDGTPEHHDSYLTDAEKASNEVMMVCCSRAKCGRLVLDL